ncbi:MAG TPA: hypothetical protein VHD33_06355, partial [Legionellaceae bacterium]|nr:hypothetical protein [Legionellaceae bacterium]
MKASSNRFTLALLFLTLVAFSCTPLMATFDQASYSQVISLKVDALALMDKSTDDYALHVSDVAALRMELNKAIEYDKHRPNNTIT